MAIGKEQTLGELVARSAERAATFDELELDYCCHGDRSLDDACAAKGLDVDDVVASLAVEDVRAEVKSSDPVALVDAIVATHHAYLWNELPDVEALAAKVAARHGSRHPELREVEQVVRELRADLEPHMLKEEHVLFPSIRALVGGRREFPFGTVANPIRVMMREHDHAGALLATLRATTTGYRVPGDGCASYRTLYERLAQLEADTHMHVHLENNVLFPTVLAIEEEPATE